MSAKNITVRGKFVVTINGEEYTAVLSSGSSRLLVFDVGGNQYDRHDSYNPNGIYRAVVAHVRDAMSSEIL